MRLRLREDSEGVASTVATLFTLVIILLLLQASVIGTIPMKQYEAERLTSLEAISAFERLRSMASALATPDDQFTVSFPLGTPAVSPFAVPTLGTLRFNPSELVTANASYQFVPRLHEARLTKLDQDVILAIDSSGSMAWNDPDRLRVSGAKEYVTHLTYPDRVAVVDFDHAARLTKNGCSTEPDPNQAHHLFSAGHTGPNYTEVWSDLDCIDQDGATNYGAALQVANDELIVYGNPDHSWAVILLTDGENTCCPNGAAGDALALAEASRARANGITVFTIGLGDDVDADLLEQIADTTGGAYYAAPTPESIRFIYFEIAMRFKGFLVCDTLTASNPMGGSLSLTLANRQYPTQVVHMESSGVAVVQPGGGFVHEGIPAEVEPTGFGTVAMRLTLLSFVGPAFSTTGSEYQFLSGQFLGATVDDTVIPRPDLGVQRQDVDNVSAFIEFWGDRGFVDPDAVARINAILDQASDRLDWGQANMTAKKPTPAKFNAESGQVQVTAAALQIEQEADAGNMNRTLADRVNNDLLRIGCQLDQFLNWYNGISFTIQSPNAAAWAIWFNETFSAVGVPISYGSAGDYVVLTIRAVDRFIVDERVIKVSFH